ncbi:cytochrome c biogenesis CcdA family protein [Kineosporia sp. A_224]|uniref:cytochrome c biogenesis CcdA family protein n=1 Tax=Kineosporia sp. A_224 TaxID=1962180 RepID=UPI000B4BF2D6|nr:cytochrome c biogenesis protein CcdA [Kineosporia sp. A_224]
MLLVLGAVVAGMLTTLAPCVLPLLPVIIGRTAVPQVSPVQAVPAALGAGRPPDADRPDRGLPRALAVTAGLGASVIAFTLLLKGTTTFIGVPREVWQVLSGGLLVAIGATQTWPGLWEHLSGRLGLDERSTGALVAAQRQRGLLGDVLTGAALGPVFSSCSPLYAYVVVTVLPASFGKGLVLLLAYTAGLCAVLLAIGVFGRRAVLRLRWAADPHGRLRRVFGLVLVGVGLLVLTGADHAVQTWLVEHSPVRPWDLDSGFLPPEGG